MCNPSSNPICTDSGREDYGKRNTDTRTACIFITVQVAIATAEEYKEHLYLGKKKKVMILFPKNNT